MKNTPLPVAYSVPSSIAITSIVTPETRLTTPSPLRPVDSKPPFLLPSSTMAEADGITTAPLDLSDQEWPLLSNVVDPPPKLIPPPADHKPPNISKRQRKRSSRRSRTKPPVPEPLPQLNFTSPSPPSTIHDNVEPSSLTSPPSPSTMIYLNDNKSNLIKPPCPSTLNIHHDVEPNELDPLPSPSSNDTNYARNSDCNAHGAHNNTINILQPPPSYDLQPSSPPHPIVSPRLHLQRFI